MVRLSAVNEEKPKTEEEIPPSRILNSNLKQLKGFTNLRRDVKIKIMESNFQNELKKLLLLFDKENCKYDQDIVLFVSQCACKAFFNEDISLVEKFINMIFDKIIQTNTFRRIKLKIMAFFSSLVSESY